MRLAVGRPDLIRSLVLLDTTADPEPSKLKYKILNLIVRLFGMQAVTKAIMPALHGKTALKDPARADERLDWQAQLSANRRSIWRAVNGVLARESIYPELGKIAAPTLVAVGEEDVGTPPAMSQRIAQAIGGAKFRIIPHAGHGSTLEQPEAVTAAIAEFLDAQKGASQAPRRLRPRLRSSGRGLDFSWSLFVPKTGTHCSGSCSRTATSAFRRSRALRRATFVRGERYA